jgi:hypothetical protein
MLELELSLDEIPSEFDDEELGGVKGAIFLLALMSGRMK